MSEHERIEVGDTVYCQITESCYMNGVVLYMPQDTGDCWRILTKSPGYESLSYVQTFQYIRKNRMVPP